MYTAGEVCDLLGIKQHVLRYWEREVPLLTPKKNYAGRKIYTQNDLQLLFRLKHLVQDRGYTLTGAGTRIWSEIQGRDHNVTSRFAELRGELIHLLYTVKKKNHSERIMSQDELIARFEQAGQGHLFDGWMSRSRESRKKLLKDLSSVDMRVLAAVKQALSGEPEGPRRLEPTPYLALDDPSRNGDACALGESLISTGRTAFLTVAGGQGSRLGFEGPKGMFEISPVRRASLFQIFAEKLLAACRRYGVRIPWYVMTSPLNHEDTRTFFEEKGFFGLDRTQVVFFPQGTFPTFDEEGRMLLSPDGGLLTNPDGHGGLVAALKNHGLFDKMRDDGTEELFFFQVDNPLVCVPDPMFLGVHRKQGATASTKAIEKTSPDEKLGTIGLIDGKKGIIEYSDLDESRMYARDENGDLLFSHGSPAIHIFSVSLLSRSDLRLPYHVARKKVKTLILDGGKAEEGEKRGVKLEKFIFDLIPEAGEALFYETSREEEFAPLKNRTGTDSIETCVRGQIEKHARHLEQCGVRVPRDASGASIHRIEISPLFAPDPPTLCEKLAGREMRIDGDTLLE